MQHMRVEKLSKFSITIKEQSSATTQFRLKDTKKRKEERKTRLQGYDWETIMKVGKLSDINIMDIKTKSYSYKYNSWFGCILDF